MTVKDIIRLSAIYLNKENVVDYLDGGADNDALSAVNTLTVCANVVINELVTSYISMIIKERSPAVSGKINFSDLSQTPLEILGVYDANGNAVGFTVSSDVINTSLNARYVEYKYLPPNYGLTDTVGFNVAEAPLRLLAYGTVSEYLLTERAFEESVIWQNRFNDALAILFPPTSKTVKERRFV